MTNSNLENIITDGIHVFELTETLRVADGYAHSRKMIEAALERAGEGSIWLFDVKRYNNVAIYRCIAIVVTINLDTDVSTLD